MNALYNAVTALRDSSSEFPMWWPVRLASLLLILSACAHDIALMKKEETLNAYGALVRWNQFERAQSFQSEHAPRLPIPANFQGVKVSGYEVLAQREDKERQTIAQRVEIRYYRADDLRERKVLDEQAWRYDENRGQWVLDSGLPRFK